MLPASRHLLPVIGVDIHIVLIPTPAGPIPTPIPHPYIGLVFDPMDYIPKIGATVNVNFIPRGNAGTGGMLGSKVHIPMGGPFAMAPTIGHDSNNFFGSNRVTAEGSYFSAAGFMVMTCNDVGMPLTAKPGKKFKPSFSKYLPTSATIPIPGGKPIIVGGPYVPDLMAMLMSLAMSFGMGALLKAGKGALKKIAAKVKALKAKLTKSLKKLRCKLGLEPVNLITGSVVYDGVDFEIAGPIPVKWERSWYSDSSNEGLLGYGTHCSYELLLEIFEDENIITVTLPDGRAAGFSLLVAKGEKFYNRSEKLTLTYRGGDTYEMFDHESRLTWLFNHVSKNVFKPVSLSNAGGLSVKFFYNEKDVLNKIIDTAGREINITLDKKNRAVKVEAEHKGFSRKLVEYSYNDAGDLIGITDANGKTTSIRYENHLMVEKTDRNGQTFYWKYDGSKTGARCIHTWGDGGILEGHIQYNKGHNIVTNSLGEGKTYYYDENDLCIKEVDALGNTVFHEYTDFMEPYRDIDEEGNVTGYTYDDRGNLKTVQKPDGSTTTYLYDADDRLLLYVDAEGKSTGCVYKDNFLSMVVAADKAVTTYEHFDNGLIKSIKNNKGQKTELFYDADHNLIKVLLPDGATGEWHYDEWGRCISAINPEKAVQYFNYDALDRVTGIKKYDGNNVKLKYNAYDQVIFAEDAQHKVKFEYTPLGSLKLREENGVAIRFGYDTEERLVNILNEHNETYGFSYDATGKIVVETGFDSIQRNYIRDRAGKVIRVNRPANKFTDYEYDYAGRLTRAEHNDGSWETYSYNRNGQLIEAVNEKAHVALLRDDAGRIIKEVQDGHTVESSYDELGKRIAVKSSLGANVKLSRNESGFVSQLEAKNNEGNEWNVLYKYNALGFETERILPGGISSAFKYDKGGHPAEHIVKSRTETVRHRSYSWNVNERLQKMVNELTNGAVSYGHDDFGNLAWAKYEDGQYDYRLPDKVGNLYRTKERSDRKYGAGGRLLESKGAKYFYDDEGNLIQKQLPDGKEWKYNWYGSGMLQKVIRPDANEVSFEYDALGRRTSKTFNQDITRWAWDGNTPLHEWKYKLTERPVAVVDEYGEITKDKPEPTENIITWIFDEGTFKPAAKVENNKVQSIITDYLGTPVEMFDADGNQTWSVDYDIYGKVRKQHTGNTIDCPFRYQGQYEDEETGLYYNRFRYYSAEEGMYFSQDPIRLSGGMSIYSYVDNCHSYVDPFGLAIIPTVTTGSNGEITTAKATVTSNDLGTGTNTNSSSRSYARDLGDSSDDAGHMIGKQLGGSGGKANVFPQNVNLNRGQFAQFEGKVADLTAKTGKVEITITFRYDNGGTRPTHIDYEAVACDGTKISRSFKNPCN